MKANQRLGRTQAHIAAFPSRFRHIKKPMNAAHNRLRLHSFQRMASRECERNAFHIALSRIAVPRIATIVCRITAPQNLNALGICVRFCRPASYPLARSYALATRKTVPSEVPSKQCSPIGNFSYYRPRNRDPRNPRQISGYRIDIGKIHSQRIIYLLT